MSTPRDGRHAARRGWVPAVMAALAVILGAALAVATNIATGLPLPMWLQDRAVIWPTVGVLTLLLMVLAVAQRHRDDAGEPEPPGMRTRPGARNLRRAVDRLLIVFVAFPVSTVVWLSVLEPAQFSPLGIAEGSAAGLSSVFDVPVVLPDWVHACADWLARHPGLGVCLVALALFLAVGSRPPLRWGHSSAPSPWFVSAGWLSALAAVTCGAGRLLTGACLGLLALLMLIRSVSLPQPFRDSAEHMLESLGFAVLGPPFTVVAMGTALLPRFTGRSRNPQPLAPPPYTRSASSTMMELARRRHDALDMPGPQDRPAGTEATPQ